MLYSDINDFEKKEKSMKRILFISHFLSRAGTETFMMNMFRGIDHKRFQIDFLIYTKKETDYTREVEDAGCKVWRITSRKESPVKWYSELNRFFKQHAKEYAAVHYCGNSLTTIAPIVFAYRYGVPIRICHAHNSSSAGLHNKVLHLLQRGIARKITTHHFACSSMAAKWFFGSGNAVVIKNGIQTSRFAYKPEVRMQIRTELDIPKNAFIIGHVGRFENEKNHSFLLDIFAVFAKAHPDARLMLIGRGVLMDAIKEKTSTLGITNKVLFMGEQKNVNELLQAFDLFLMPSTFEGQPFVLIEAQCAGLPCLVSDVINDDICLTPNIRKLSLQQNAEEWSKQMTEMLNTFVRKDESMTLIQKGYDTSHTISYIESVYDGEL